jgi:hypothetical protein
VMSPVKVIFKRCWKGSLGTVSIPTICTDHILSTHQWCHMLVLYSSSIVSKISMLHQIIIYIIYINRQVLWERPNKEQISTYWESPYSRMGMAQYIDFLLLIGNPNMAILNMVMVMCLTRLSTAWTASSINFYKMVCVFYDVLATIYRTCLSSIWPRRQLRVMGVMSMSHVTSVMQSSTIHPPPQPQCKVSILGMSFYF